MNTEIHKISCAVCEDLLPLFQDGIASADSSALVENHLTNCEKCRETVALLKQESAINHPQNLPAETDGNVIKNIKTRISWWTICVITVATLFGIGLSFSSYNYLIIIVLPLVCGATYWFEFKAWKLVPALASLLWFAASMLNLGYFTSISWAISSAFAGCVTPFVLCLVGALAAKLLKFGFSKDKEQ